MYNDENIRGKGERRELQHCQFSHATRNNNGMGRGWVKLHSRRSLVKEESLAWNRERPLKQLDDQRGFLPLVKTKSNRTVLMRQNVLTDTRTWRKALR